MVTHDMDRRQGLFHRILVDSDIGDVQPAFSFQMELEVREEDIPHLLEFLRAWRPVDIRIIARSLVLIAVTESPRNRGIEGDCLVDATFHR